jgi:hypothetical protein
MNFIKCPYEALPSDDPDSYVIRPKPLNGALFVSFNNLGFISGQVRVRGKVGGKYPFYYHEMIENVFGREENTIEVCSGNVNGGCFTIDINPQTNPQIVDDGQTLAKIPNDTFNRWRCDPPTIKIQQEKCMALIYQSLLDYSRRGQESVKRIPCFSCYWAL